MEEISHKDICERLADLESKVDSINHKTEGIVAAFEAARGAFIVLEWIGKTAKPVIWIIAVGAAITAIYEKWIKP